MQAECSNGNGGIIWSELTLSSYHNDHGNLIRDGNPSSSFQRSCRQARLEWDNNAIKLVAVCGDGRGGERQSSIYVHDMLLPLSQIAQNVGNVVLELQKERGMSVGMIKSGEATPAKSKSYCVLLAR